MFIPVIVPRKHVHLIHTSLLNLTKTVIRFFALENRVKKFIWIKVSENPFKTDILQLKALVSRHEKMEGNITLF